MENADERIWEEKDLEQVSGGREVHSQQYFADARKAYKERHPDDIGMTGFWSWFNKEWLPYAVDEYSYGR